MTKAMGIFFTAVMLCSWIMASFVVGAPPSSQPLSKSPQAEPIFPDIHAYKIEGLPESPKSGQILYLKGFYSVTGCASKPFFGKIEVDGQIIGEEKELKNWCPDCTKPNCKLWWDFFLEVQWTVVPGNHTIVFTADSKNDIIEGPQNEFNNAKTVTISVPFPQIEKIKDMKTKQPIPVPVPGTR